MTLLELVNEEVTERNFEVYRKSGLMEYEKLDEYSGTRENVKRVLTDEYGQLFGLNLIEVEEYRYFDNYKTVKVVIK